MPGLHFDITGDNSNFLRKLDETRNGVRTTSQQIEESGMSIEQMFGRLAKGAAAFGAGITTKEIISNIVRVRGEFQQLEVAFNTMLGSDVKANALMQQLVKTAATTPFDLQSVANGAKQLLAYGENVDNVNEDLVRLGNIASGLSQPLSDIVYLYGTTMTQGRLYTQDFNQFTGRGIPMVKELAKQFGVAESEVKGLVEAGKVGFPEVQKVIKSLTNEGGMFYNLMEDQSRTITGQISNISDSISMMYNNIGKSSEGLINDALSGVSYLIENYEAIGEQVIELTAAYGAYKAVIISIAAYQGFATGITYSAEIAELSKLIPLKEQSSNKDVQAAIASGKLTQSKAEQVIAIRSEIAAKLQSLQATEAQTKAEYANAMLNYKNATLKLLVAKQNMAIAQSQMNIAIKSGTADEIAMAQKNAHTASLELNNAAIAKNSVHKSLNIAATNKKTAAEAASSFQTGINTASQVANTTSTNILTVAKTRLAAASRALGLSMLANPYVLITASVIGLGYAVYKVATAETELERAHKRLNEANSDVEKSLVSEVSKLTSLERKLSETKKGTEEYYAIKKTIVDNYEQYYKGLDGEIERVGDLSTVYGELVEKMRLSIGQRKFETFFKAEQDNLDKVISEKLDTAYETLIDKYGKTKGINLYNQFFDSAMRGEALSPSVVRDLESATFFDMKWGDNAKDGVIDFRSNVLNLRSEIAKETKATDVVLDEYKSKFRITDKDVSDILLGNSKGDSNTPKVNKTISQLILDLKKAESNVKSLREQSQKGLIDTSKVDEAVSDLDVLKKKYKSMTGVDYDKMGTPSKGETAAEKQRKDQAKLAEEIKKSAQERKDLLIQSELDARQQQIDLLEEGSEKELAQIQLNYDRKYQEITKRERELLQKMQDEERKQWEKDNPKFKEKNLQFTSTIKSLTPEQRSQYDKEYSLAFQKQEKDTQALLNKLLEKYRDYEAQKTAIEKEGNTEIAYLQSKRTDANAEEIDRAIAVAKQKVKEGIQQIDDTRAEATAKDNPFLRNLFGDTSQMAFKDLQNLIDQAKQLRSYLSGTGDSKGITFIDAEQLKVIEQSPDELDKLKKALDNLLKGSKSNEWDDILKGFDKGLAKIKSAKGSKEFSEGMQDIGESASKASDMISGVSDDLSSMFEAMGNTDAADAMSGVQDAMNAISNIGQGFAKGGIVGGIAAAVGEAANFIGKAFAANARHKAALKEIMNEAIAQQREYNLLLMQQNLEYEKAVTIFGTDTYGKAANGVNVMKEAISDLNDELRGTSQQRNNQSRDTFFNKYFGVNDPQAELKKAYAGLAEIEIKTGHKKTGLFGWGKGKDVYSSVLDVFPQLIDASGKFDKNVAETIIKTRTMSDESKNALQNMIDLAQQAEDAYKELKDYMTDIFGDLGSSMTDALVNAFVNGTDAAQAFTDSVSNMLETLAKQMVYSVTLAPLMEKAQKEMMDVMQNTGLSDEQKFNKWAGILNSLVGDAVDQQELANRLMKEYQQAAKDKGFDILNSSSSSSSSSSKSGTMQMTQDEGRELNGRFTAMQISNEEIKNSMMSMLVFVNIISVSVNNSNIVLTEIKNLMISSNSYLEDIAKYTKPLLDVGDKLDRIESNTKGLTSK